MDQTELQQEPGPRNEAPAAHKYAPDPRLTLPTSPGKHDEVRRSFSATEKEFSHTLLPASKTFGTKWQVMLPHGEAGDVAGQRLV